MTARKTLYGLVHKGAEVKFGCLPTDERDAAYRDWLAMRTGQRSCKGLTELQLAALCKALNWQGGLDDPALDRFCQRTAHVSKARFLTKGLISQVITGLEKWIAGGAQ